MPRGQEAAAVTVLVGGGGLGRQRWEQSESVACSMQDQGVPACECFT